MHDPSLQSACRDFRALQLSRRRLLSIGGAGLLGLNIPKLLAAAESQKSAPPVRAKSVIFLYQFGGPSHLDTFDMKPDAPTEIRGPLKTISSKLAGVPICEHLPRMAQVMDKVSLVRTMHHGMKNHNPASYYALSGHEPPIDDIRLKESVSLYPAYGSVVDRLAPAASGLPTFVAYPFVIRDGENTPGQRASFLGQLHDPLLVTSDPGKPDFSLPELSLPAEMSLGRLESRRQLQHLIDEQTRSLDASAEARGLEAHYSKAISLLTSSQVRRAFNLSQESPELRDRYGRTTYGQSCLLARRLVESGVKFVNVYISNSIGGQSTTAGGWDTHGFGNTSMYSIIPKYHLPLTDQTLPTLLIDLDERGLLDTTLVVWMGEFGRTPKLNAQTSRDHWPSCYTALLAGGGVRRGHVHGASDKQGAFPARDPVRPDDLAATMFHLLGIDPHTHVPDVTGRPLAISSGEVIRGVIA